MSGDVPGESNPYQSPTDIVVPSPTVLPATRIQRLSRKRLLLLAMLTVAAMGGFCLGWFTVDAGGLRAITLLESLLLTGLTVQWCFDDLRELGLPRWKHLAPLMVLCPGPLVMIPIYFLGTRGAWGVVAVLKALAFAVLLVIVNIGALLLGALLSGEIAFS